MLKGMYQPLQCWHLFGQVPGWIADRSHLLLLHSQSRGDPLPERVKGQDEIHTGSANLNGSGSLRFDGKGMECYVDLTLDLKRLSSSRYASANDFFDKDSSSLLLLPLESSTWKTGRWRFFNVTSNLHDQDNRERKFLNNIIPCFIKTGSCMNSRHNSNSPASQKVPHPV